MVLAISKALSMDIGLIATFGGIGVIVNVIVVYIAIQIRGERQQNQEYREQLLVARRGRALGASARRACACASQAARLAAPR